jgi:phage shock protein C
MVCQNCQKDIADGSKFCYNCGAQLSGSAPTPGAAFLAPEKRLMRSTRDKKLGGVCAGLAEYFDLDPTIVRVIWIIVTICSGGTGFLIYVILWIVLPVAPALPIGSVSGPITQV